MRRVGNSALATDNVVLSPVSRGDRSFGDESGKLEDSGWIRRFETILECLSNQRRQGHSWMILEVALNAYSQLVRQIDCATPCPPPAIDIIPVQIDSGDMPRPLAWDCATSACRAPECIRIG